MPRTYALPESLVSFCFSSEPLAAAKLDSCATTSARYFVQQDVQGLVFAYMSIYAAQFLRRQEHNQKLRRRRQE